MKTPLSIETSRLKLRWLETHDAAFIFDLVNDPMWLRHIGDKNVSDLDDARHYLETGPLAMYQSLGFGLNLVSLIEDNSPIGICGLLKRESLDDVDLGFALLPAYRGRGYAREAAAAVLEHGFRELKANRVVAILKPDNAASKTLLLKLGFSYEKDFQTEPNSSKLALYHIDR